MSPPSIREYVNVKFEDKMASWRVKKGDSFLIKKKTRRMACQKHASEGLPRLGRLVLVLHNPKTDFLALRLV